LAGSFPDRIRTVIQLPDDFRDVLVCLHDSGAEFVVVGGHAVAFHGHPRATKDLDVLVGANAENAAKVYRALATFGAPLQTFAVTVEDFAAYQGVLQIGVEPLRIDILTTISGVSFVDAAADAPTFDVDGRKIRVIGIAALLRNKLAAGREQDLADIAALHRAGTG
jgi:predicted nucleotidyltransferase